MNHWTHGERPCTASLLRCGLTSPSFPPPSNDPQGLQVRPPAFLPTRRIAASASPTGECIRLAAASISIIDLSFPITTRLISSKMLLVITSFWRRVRFSRRSCPFTSSHTYTWEFHNLILNVHPMRHIQEVCITERSAAPSPPTNAVYSVWPMLSLQTPTSTASSSRNRLSVWIFNASLQLSMYFFFKSFRLHSVWRPRSSQMEQSCLKESSTNLHISMQSSLYPGSSLIEELSVPSKALPIHWMQSNSVACVIFCAQFEYTVVHHSNTKGCRDCCYSLFITCFTFSSCSNQLEETHDHLDSPNHLPFAFT